MATKRNGSLSKYLILHNGVKLKKGYHNSDVEIWSAGSTVTYYVDTGIDPYIEEVDYGSSCLSPTTFVPEKEGWTFIGWREDATASSEVLSEKIMDSDPIDLYAVFNRDVTVYYYNNSDIKNTTTGVRYYNNANVDNPSFTLTQTDEPNWTERGWSTTNSGDAEIMYGDGETFIREDDITLYGLYEQNITLTYNGNGSTSGSMSDQSGTRYWAPAGYINPKFTLAANKFDRSNYTFIKWALGSTGGVQYDPGSSVTLSENTNAYAVWEPNEIVVFAQTVAANPWEGGSVSIYDRNYVNMTDTRAAAWVYYSDDTTETDTETITINYGRYKTAVITFSSYDDNSDIWYEGNRRATTQVNGVNVYDTTSQNPQRDYTLTTTATSITMYADATIKAGVGTGSWVQGFIYPTKITLKK